MRQSYLNVRLSVSLFAASRANKLDTLSIQFERPLHDARKCMHLSEMAIICHESRCNLYDVEAAGLDWRRHSFQKIPTGCEVHGAMPSEVPTDRSNVQVNTTPIINILNLLITLF